MIGPQETQLQGRQGILRQRRQEWPQVWTQQQARVQGRSRPQELLWQEGRTQEQQEQQTLKLMNTLREPLNLMHISLETSNSMQTLREPVILMQTLSMQDHFLLAVLLSSTTLIYPVTLPEKLILYFTSLTHCG